MTLASARPVPAPDSAAAVEAAVGRIIAFGRHGLAAHPECSNIASAIGVAPYRAVASEVAAWAGRGPVLDWGAGWGQTSLLLHAHGATVTAFDVEDKGAAAGLLAGTGVAYVVAPGPVLPFPDAAFAAVLNCGVLEHVEDQAAALAELRRLLRPRGRLFTYHLPNRHAYTEWLGRRLGRFHHERLFTRAQAVSTFERAGFRVTECRSYHVLPRNLWGRRAARLASAPGVARAYDALDGCLVRVPGLRKIATAWALVAERR
jgi:2-polyprenyl-3-methyl-5-hydroxy-6-metoxy-1,4-benzoquinol methylase